MSTSPSSMKKGSHPGQFFVVVGGLFIALAVVGLMAQIQTNEAYITNAGMVNVFKPDWAILFQIPNLVMGNLDAQEGGAAIFGWGIELIFMGCILGFEHMSTAAERSGRMMSKLFLVLAIGIVVFNGYTDYNFGSFGSGSNGHLAFALIMSFIVGFFFTIGFYFVEQGWHRV